MYNLYNMYNMYLYVQNNIYLYVYQLCGKYLVMVASANARSAQD